MLLIIFGRTMGAYKRKTEQECAGYERGAFICDFCDNWGGPLCPPILATQKNGSFFECLFCNIFSEVTLKLEYTKCS